jgi:hypothetical protein
MLEGIISTYTTEIQEDTIRRNLRSSTGSFSDKGNSRFFSLISKHLSKQEAIPIWTSSSTKNERNDITKMPQSVRTILEPLNAQGNIELVRSESEYYDFNEPESDNNILYDLSEDKSVQNKRSSVRLGSLFGKSDLPRGSISGTIRGREEVEMNLQVRLMEGRHIEGEEMVAR